MADSINTSSLYTKYQVAYWEYLKERPKQPFTFYDEKVCFCEWLLNTNKTQEEIIKIIQGFGDYKK